MPPIRKLLAAQFVSSLADNALLIVAIALLNARGLPPWWAPLLKLCFTIAYVLLAPCVGVWADRVSKARLMGCMSVLKLVGALALVAGVHPVAGYALVGLASAAYAPAKYGLVTEIVSPCGLVAANGALEVSVVLAALIGTGLGGALVGPWLGLDAALWAMVALYLLSVALNLLIPDSGVRHRVPVCGLGALLREFACDNRRLWADPEGALSLAVTTLFWGLAATLQFAVLRWSEDCLGLPLHEATGLQLAVALGVIAGAALAGWLVPLSKARRVLGFGLVFGLAMPLIALLREPLPAALLLALAGMSAGLLVVPLNALLQHRGALLLTAGRSVAVQGFNENASMLAMLAGYALLIRQDVRVDALLCGLGLIVAAAMALLMLRGRPRAGRTGVRPS
ncbi:MAG: lysophospholipid transporter LplT [Pelomonas sp.]|nr:lysophospholipid transporter LplT [Roseateles sp.]